MKTKKCKEYNLSTQHCHCVGWKVHPDNPCPLELKVIGVRNYVTDRVYAAYVAVNRQDELVSVHIGVSWQKALDEGDSRRLWEGDTFIVCGKKLKMRRVTGATRFETYSVKEVDFVTPEKEERDDRQI